MTLRHASRWRPSSIENGLADYAVSGSKTATSSAPYRARWVTPMRRGKRTTPKLGKCHPWPVPRRPLSLAESSARSARLTTQTTALGRTATCGGPIRSTTKADQPWVRVRSGTTQRSLNGVPASRVRGYQQVVRLVCSAGDHAWCNPSTHLSSGSPTTDDRSGDSDDKVAKVTGTEPADQICAPRDSDH